jgi:hypothetical protein
MTFEDINDTSEAHELRITRCKSCRERIIFLPTSSGKMIPIDADTVDAEDETYIHGKHVSHFATCAEADKFRRPRK